MSNKIGLSMKIDADLKNEAEQIMEQYGLNPTTAITMFYKQIARERAIPPLSVTQQSRHRTEPRCCGLSARAC